MVSFGADQIASQHGELPSTMVAENRFVLGLSRFAAEKTQRWEGTFSGGISLEQGLRMQL